MLLLKQVVVDQLDQALDRLDVDSSIHGRPEVRLEYARDEKFGDYACTVPMDKRVRELYADQNTEFKNPRKFAEAIVQELQVSIPSVFSSVDIAGPGFINLRVSNQILFKKIEQACFERKKFGHSIKKDPRKVIFEFVSANPTGPLNIVSARAAALGDSCCNLLEAAGDDVHREFYVNDFGNQVNLLGQSSLLRFLEMKGVPIKFAQKNDAGDAFYEDTIGLPFPAGGYHGDYLTKMVESLLKDQSEIMPKQDVVDPFHELSRENNIDDGFLNTPEYKSLCNAIGTQVLDGFISSQKKDLKNFRVEFDNFFREKELHDAGSVLGIRKKIEPYIKKEEGKEFFQSTEFGDDKDRVIVRDDGRPTYLLADIAYHFTKIERGFDQIINIWGPDHHGYIARLSGAMQALEYPKDSFRVLIAQQVNLLENGEQVKMSKRAGKVITMNELIEDVPVDVARYFFVMRSFEAHLDFDLAVARDTTDKNPYYYVAYAHARICSIFRILKEERNLEPGCDLEALSSLELTPQRRALLWLVSRLPEEVASAAIGPEPHHLVAYLYNLASTFSSFYNQKENRIKEQDDATAIRLLTVLDAVAITLRNGLELLGMTAPEKM